jgi:phosphatidylglycerophosphatase C
MNLALFDFDGTITNKDSYRAFIYYSASRRRQLAGTLVLAVPLLGYRLGWLQGSPFRSQVSRVAFAFRSEAEVRDQGQRYAREVIPGFLRPNALERLAWHRAQGDRIVIVSASLDAYLRPWCEQHGYDLLCSELESRSGLLTGGYRGGDCSGQEKARRVQATYPLGSFPRVYAYGDTSEDHALLGLAHERYFCWQRLP